METAFHYDLAQKQLGFRLRERISAPPGVELKGNAQFNTVTGTLGYVGTLKAALTFGEEVKDAGSKPLKLGAGVYAEGADLVKAVPRPQLHISAKKAVSLLDGPQTVGMLKAWGNFDPQSGQVTARRASIKVAHKWLGFTKRQDLRLAGGMDLDWPLGAREPTVTPYFQVRENNWAVNYRLKKWLVTYDL